MKKFEQILSIIQDCQRQCNSALNFSESRYLWYQKLSNSLLANTSSPLKIMKNSRWEMDSLITYIPQGVISKAIVVVKIHDESFPIASNIYSDLRLLKIMGASGFTSKVLMTRILFSEANIPLRVVFYEYVNGVDAATFIAQNEKRISEIIFAFKQCVKGLIDIGIHPYLKDPSDFVISEELNGQLKVRLVDLNSALNVTKSSLDSRRGILSLLDVLITRFVDSKKPPYRGVMESLK